MNLVCNMYLQLRYTFKLTIKSPRGQWVNISNVAYTDPDLITTVYAEELALNSIMLSAGKMMTAHLFMFS